jgi:flagellum-specific peptidoglycan hydrolase FlgJ
MNPSQRLWVLDTTNQALEAKHVYARMAACEAALESDFGTSALARLGFNLFGMKQHTHPIYGTLNLPTREFLNGEWVPKISAWVQYENVAECFADRMETLVRLRDVYAHYQAALTAPDPAVYIAEVSKTWSTDPNRAQKVLAIYAEIFPYESSSDINFTEAI